MFQKVAQKALWIATIAILVISAAQGISGHWVTFYLIWPGSESSAQTFLRAMLDLANYHKAAGVAVGVLSILILILALGSLPSIYVRILSLVGLVLTVVTIIGAYKYVTSGFQDRWSLGQMADGFIGVFTAYFLQLLLMFKTPQFLLNLRRAGSNSKG